LRTTLPLSTFAPDDPDLGTNNAIGAVNVIPRSKSFGPLPSLGAFSDALAAAPRGLVSFAKDGTYYVFAGTATKLYKLNLSDGTWEDVTRTTGGDYAVAAGDNWSFLLFGDLLVAMNGTDAAQKYDITSSTDFEALGGTPPTAKFQAAVRQFIVTGNLSSETNKIQWSEQGDAEGWTVGDNLSDFQILDAGGEVVGITGGDYGVVFQRNRINRMDFVGSALIFSISPVVEDRGCMASGSIVRLDNLTYFLSDDGFYAFNGASAVPISPERVTRFFFSDLDQNNLDEISAAVDPLNTLVVWSYPGSGNTGGANKLLIYNWAIDKWSYAETSAQFLASAYSGAYDLEDLDNINTNLDLIPYSLDSRVWQEGALVLSGFDENNKYGGFVGSNLEAKVTTAEFGGINTSMVTNTWPIVDGTTSVTVRIGSRMRQGDDVTWTDANSMTEAGSCPVRSNGHFHRGEITVSSGIIWDHLSGLSLEYQDTGAR
tara:strand:- start:146 stop:1600 length:1455 start_codon:yes stop_codon:yes gene_type:complete